MILVYVSAIVAGLGVYLPSPHDAHGWGLRVRVLDLPHPLLVGEGVGRGAVQIVLRNQSGEERAHGPLQLARAIGDLEVRLLQPDGKAIRRFGRNRPDPMLDRPKLPAGRALAAAFEFRELGYDISFPAPGEYQLRTALKTPQGLIHAPAVKLSVIEPAERDILANRAVPLTGYQTKWPTQEQETAAVQQIRIGGRVWLVYRRFYSAKLGGGVSLSARLAELPRQVDVAIEGAFGVWQPLTVTYSDGTAAGQKSRIVVNAVDGTPWTEEDERILRERRKGPAPAPKP